MTKNKLAHHFNFKDLIQFTTPTMIMLVFMSLYQTVDGVFVSNLVGELGLTALNVVYPFTCVIIAISIMLSTGAGASIALSMGQQKNREAKEDFTCIILVGMILSFVILILGSVYMEPLIYMLGATPKIYEMCYNYLWIMVLSTPLAVLQLLFQIFFVTAGKPKIGLTLTVLGGITNIVLDYLLMVPFHLGMRGTAIATSAGYGIMAVYGLYYFTVHRHGTLYFVKPKVRIAMLKRSCMNGSSEMINNLSVAITTYLFNVVGLAYLKEEGVAAISIILYAQFIMTSIFTGYATGVAPVISYKYGAEDTEQIQKIFKSSMIFVAVTSIATFFLSFPLAKPIVAIFASHHPYVFDLSVHGFYLFSISFLFTGINIFASALFTAFSNGKVSAILSFLRTFVFLVIALIGFPMLIGENGIWLAVPLAEGAAVIFSITAIYKYKHSYHLVQR